MYKRYGIIEIGSNNTKVHIYEANEVIYENTITIEFKKNYNNKILPTDLEKLYEIIENSLQYTENINLYGCSIFRNISQDELENINKVLYDI